MMKKETIPELLKTAKDCAEKAMANAYAQGFIDGTEAAASLCEKEMEKNGYQLSHEIRKVRPGSFMPGTGGV